MLCIFVCLVCAANMRNERKQPFLLLFAVCFVQKVSMSQTVLPQFENSLGRIRSPAPYPFPPGRGTPSQTARRITTFQLSEPKWDIAFRLSLITDCNSAKQC